MGLVDAAQLAGNRPSNPLVGAIAGSVAHAEECRAG